MHSKPSLFTEKGVSVEKSQVCRKANGANSVSLEYKEKPRCITWYLNIYRKATYVCTYTVLCTGWKSEISLVCVQGVRVEKHRLCTGCQSEKAQFVYRVSM